MIKVQIYTPDTQREIEAEAVFLPGSMGQFEVLKDHAPIISTLAKGTIVCRNGQNEEKIEIKTGVMRLKDNNMQICCEV